MRQVNALIQQLYFLFHIYFGKSAPIVSELQPFNVNELQTDIVSKYLGCTCIPGD